MEQLNRAKYIKPYKITTSDKDLLTLAEEGIEDYFKELEDYDKAKWYASLHSTKGNEY